jgi:hypothetical protein
MQLYSCISSPRSNYNIQINRDESKYNQIKLINKVYMNKGSMVSRTVRANRP